MLRAQITTEKVNTIRKLFIQGKFNQLKLSRDLGISRTTIKNYVAEFKVIQEYYPEKLKDMQFFLKRITKNSQAENIKEFYKLVPGLVSTEYGVRLKARIIWKRYLEIAVKPLTYTPFKRKFFQWCNDNDISFVSTKRIASFTPEEKLTLNKWRNGNDHQKWQIAVVLQSANEHKSLLKVAEKVECTFPTVLRWLKIYETVGLTGYERTYTQNKTIATTVKTKQDNLIHLLSQTPKIHGLQRVSWTSCDLAKVYTQVYGVSMSQSTVSKYLKQKGVTTRRAKEVLTSPDPLYREKFQAIQIILENLGEKERFFSIDEYGPFAVKPKGGKVFSMPGKFATYPQVKKSKGWFVMTAALELATNQVTHFYSMKKDTEEMIKLLDILLIQYRDMEKLYISWDAASWHASKRLYKYIDELNSDAHRNINGTPLIGLAPLPSCAQFLNVIESVFSGMAKSIIRNSDYESLDACKAAIDLYFKERNKHFLENPKRAGNKIWGKERVKPVFDKANICKNL